MQTDPNYSYRWITAIGSTVGWEKVVPETIVVWPFDGGHYEFTLYRRPR